MSKCKHGYGRRRSDNRSSECLICVREDRDNLLRIVGVEPSDYEWMESAPIGHSYQWENFKAVSNRAYKMARHRATHDKAAIKPSTETPQEKK